MQALASLGGVGKTQTAVEYAHRHFYDSPDYDIVLWALADTPTSLSTDFGKIANLLNLPGAKPDDPEATRKAVHKYLETATGYLLILDNADEPADVKDYLPNHPTGHILVTSRSADLGDLEIAAPIELEDMLPEDALAFLKGRTNRPSLTAAEEQAAHDLAHDLGYLPLALEQAGAYIAKNKMSFADYLAEYRNLDLELLEAQKPQFGGYHLSVARTWQKSFDAVRAKSPAAADLLTVSAFFAPEAIPYELITKGAAQLGEPLTTAFANEKRHTVTLNTLLSDLETYSLIKRDGKAKTYDVHRMVQAVIRAKLGETLPEWIAVASRCALSVSPDDGHQNWTAWSRLLTHVVAVLDFARVHDCEDEHVANLTGRTAVYLLDTGLYAQAEPLFKCTLEIRERVLGLGNPDTALSLNNLAALYKGQGNLALAKPLYRRALYIRKLIHGLNHPDTAVSLNNLAGVYQSLGKSTKAEPLYKRALEIWERILGPDHPDTAVSLNNLADLYEHRGELSEAEPLYKRALEIWECVFGPDHPNTANSLNNLAHLYQTQGKLAEAEALYKRALDIRSRVLGSNHPDTAVSLNNLATLYDRQGWLTDAESLYKRALEIREHVFGLDHTDTANSLINLAHLYQKQGKLAEAEQMYERGLEIYESALGSNHPDTAKSLNALAGLYYSQGKMAEAEQAARRVLKVFDSTLGPEHPNVAAVCKNLARVLTDLGRDDEAAAFRMRAASIRKAHAQRNGLPMPDEPG